jgi:acetoin utilization deacetylase AcuC-like enzyme
MKVFYRVEQNAVNANAYSPSAGKPAKVVDDWLQRGLIRPQDIQSFHPVTREQLYRAHDAAFVDGVLSLKLANGFSNRDSEVAAALPYTSGSLLAAARHALDHGENTCSPTSGFHHASYSAAVGFCTFNGLMVTALDLLDTGKVQSIGIIDCDVHYGDGTDDIIRTLGVTGVRHHTMGKRFHDVTDVGPEACEFLAWLDAAIDDCRNVDLVIYQAGADPHVRDPLGGLLTGVQMAQRDHAVFKAFQRRPLVWNLAGGYQRDAEGGIGPVLKLHRATAEIQNQYQPPSV